LKLPFQSGVILDNAVVSDRHEAVAAHVRMCVDVVGGSVGSPARVANADTTGCRAIMEALPPIPNPAGPPAQVQRRAASSGHGTAMVAPVLQPPQALNQDRLRFSVSHVADNAAHASAPCPNIPRIGLLRYTVLYRFCQRSSLGLCDFARQ